MNSHTLIPFEILCDIAWRRRDVYIAISATCRQLRGELSLIKGIKARRFVRRHVYMDVDQALIKDAYWCYPGDDDIITAPQVMFWLHAQLIEIKYPDTCTIIYSYDNKQYQPTREIYKTRGQDANGGKCYRHIDCEYTDGEWEPVTPCTQFEAVITEYLEERIDDLIIHDVRAFYANFGEYTKYLSDRDVALRICLERKTRL
ncbi:hypothetical protein F-M6_0024 [Faustovirus]|nr:hypothetical protein F-M6_0024 [Faustovirus]